MIRKFKQGFTVPFRAMKLIATKPDLLFLSILPAALTIFLYSWIYNQQIPSLISGLSNALTGQLLNWGFHAEPWVSITSFLIKVFFFFISFISFSFLSNLLAIPLNDILAQRVEMRLGMTDVPPYQWTQTLRVVWIDAFKTFFAGSMGVVLLLVSWVPVINLIAFALTCLLYSFQYLTYPQTRRLEPLWISIGFLFQHFWTCFGMGMGFSLISLVPFSSGILLPVAVVSGTLLYSELKQG